MKIQSYIANESCMMDYRQIIFLFGNQYIIHSRMCTLPDEAARGIGRGKVCKDRKQEEAIKQFEIF